MKTRPLIIPVFITHAGCRHRCVFCNQRAATGQSAGLPSETQIHQTIERFMAYRGANRRPVEISFYGGNFLGLPLGYIQKLLTLSNAYVARGRADGIRFSTRPDTIDDERLALIRPYAVRTIELGVQSMNDDVLEICQRGHTSQDTCRAVAMLSGRSYHLGLQMMVGLPGDSPAGAVQSAGRVADMAPDFVRIYPTLVLAESQLAEWYAQGRYVPMELDPAVNLTKELYKIFAGRGIRVVRMGLQPTDELNSRAGVLAGPFHPAFGEMVRSRLWLDALQRCIRAHHLAGGRLRLQAHPSQISSLTGNKACNIKHLMEKFSLSEIEIRSNPHQRPKAVLVNDRSCSLF